MLNPELQLHIRFFFNVFINFLPTRISKANASAANNIR